MDFIKEARNPYVVRFYLRGHVHYTTTTCTIVAKHWVGFVERPRREKLKSNGAKGYLNVSGKASRRKRPPKQGVGHQNSLGSCKGIVIFIKRSTCSHT